MHSWTCVHFHLIQTRSDGFVYIYIYIYIYISIYIYIYIYTHQPCTHGPVYISILYRHALMDLCICMVPYLKTKDLSEICTFVISQLEVSWMAFLCIAILELASLMNKSDSLLIC